MTMALDPISLARLFHKHYESLAPEYGYRTREESAVPWEEVPEGNKALMCATAAAVLDTLVRDGEVRYKMADGSLVGCEFTYVGELEFFDDCDEPVELVRETMALLKAERYTHISSSAQVYLDALAEAEALDAEEAAG